MTDPELKGLLRRFRVAVVVAWWLPVAVSVVLQSFLGFWTLYEAFFVLLNLTGLYCVAFTVVAVHVLQRPLHTVLLRVQEANGAPVHAPELRQMMRWFVGMFLLYTGFGAPTVYLTLAVWGLGSFSLGEHLYASFGVLPSVLISAFPVFFLTTDMLGRTLAPRGVRTQMAPLWLKLTVLGLCSPVVVDIVLLLYYYDRTGFLRPETLLLWFGLVGAAGIGTALASRSLHRSLEPLKRAAVERSTEEREPLQPVSLDEVGLLTTAWSEMLRERAQRDARLREAQKLEAVGQLTGGIAHDFNNLLTVITGNLELVSHTVSPEDRELIQDALAGAERAAQLTQGLLSFSRRQALRQVPIVSNELLWNVERLLRAGAGGRVALSFPLRPEVRDVSADRNQLENALLNLVINARDASEDGGRIRVWAEDVVVDASDDAPRYTFGTAPTEGAFVAFVVSDEGSGIPEDVLPRVIEPFFTTKGVGRGSGLGLSMVYGFAEQSGGALLIETSPAGTTMRLVLPCSSPAEVPVHDQVVQGAYASLDGLLALVVDDQVPVRTVVVRQLEAAGLRCVQASTIEGALESLARWRVDVLVTDISLGEGATGWDLAQSARARHPDLATVLMTGFDREGGGRARDLRMNEVLLHKPLTQDRLLEAVSSVCAQAGREASDAG